MNKKNDIQSQAIEAFKQATTLLPFESIEKPVSQATYDIAPGATVEEVKAMFFDELALKVSDDKLYRLDRSGHRYYYAFDQSGEPLFFPSITTLISQTMPKDERLIKWVADMGYQQAEEYKNERASYGTFMHGQYAELMISGEYDLSTLRNKLDFYIESECLPVTFISYADSLRKNMLSLAQWMLDFDFTPIAIEMPIVNYRDGYALTLDVAGYISENGKKELVIVDFKSGKAFHEENEIQLFGQRDTWNLKFPDFPINRVFNFRPKDWRNKPTYEFKEQTNSPNAAKLPFLLELARIEDKKIDNTLIICDGVINLGNKNLSDTYKTFSLSELVKKTRAERNPNEETAINVDELKINSKSTELENSKDKSNEIKKPTIRKRSKTNEKGIEKLLDEKTNENSTITHVDKNNALNGLKKANKTKLLNDNLDI